MGAFIEQLGQQAASNALGGIMGLFMGDIADKRQLRQQEKLQNLQIGGQKQMVDYNMMKQLQMWKDTNYAAQVGEMEKAGINPALLYGMKGGGGVTTGNPGAGGVSGSEAPKGGGEIQAAMQMGIQSRLLQAQEENIRADTKVKETQAAKTAGVDTKEAETRILDLTQGIQNKQAQEGLTKVETQLKNLEKDVMGATVEERTDEIIWRSLRALEELDQVARQTFIQKATMNSVIDKAKAEATGAVLRNILTEAQTDETKQHIQNLITQLELSKDQLYKTNPLQRRAISNMIERTWKTIADNKNEDGQSLIEAILKLVPMK